jgi:hypothetical protein
MGEGKEETVPLYYWFRFLSVASQLAACMVEVFCAVE